MATEAQLVEGIKRADKAGDSASVKALGSALVAMRAKAATPPKDDSAARGLMAGALKPIDNAVSALQQIPGVKSANDAISRAVGLSTGEQAVQANDAMRANNTRTGYQTLGNIVGTAPTMALPGGALVQSGAAGALLSDSDTGAGVALDAGISGIAGKAGQALFNGAAYLAKPAVSKAGQMLYDAGVPQTLGQIASQGKGWGARALAGAEEALTSVPLLGDMINNARSHGVEKLNVAMGNRILSNIGESLPKNAEAGTEMIDAVANRLSAKYTALVPKLNGNFDGQFAADLGKAKALTATLPDQKQRQFANIVYDVFGNRAKSATLSGQALKDAESRLTRLTKEYRNSSDADQRIMADAIDKVRQGLRSMVARSNPQHANELQALNKGWAQLGQLRKAASAPGNATGVVTPAQALSAAKKAKVRDDLAIAAKQILSNNTPDSGTAKRAGWGLLASGAAPIASPYLAAPAAASALYTKPGMTALNALVFAPRGKGPQMTASMLRKLGKAAPAAIPPLLKQDR